MWLSRCVQLVAVLGIAVAVGFLGCGGDGGPTGNPDPCDSLVVLGSATSDWVCTGDCNYSALGTAGFVCRDSTFRDSSTRCMSLRRDPYPCEWRSAQRIDFRTYSAARLRARLVSPRSDTDRNEVSATVTVLSNVPGTPDLTVLETVTTYGSPQEFWYDVSLENVLTYSEATVQVRLTLHASRDFCPDTELGYLRDFEIVGVPKCQP